ncbi:MAG: esterase, partial [Lachnospiraceae bacterium]|nr:esterase [Lachnospiraceae bacterium]
MAELNVRFYSNCLCRTVEFKMLLPNEERKDIPWEEDKHRPEDMKTLLLLHGYTGDGDIWVNKEQATDLNIAVVAPSGDNSFWLDGEATGRKYASYIGAELIDYVRRTFGIAKTPDKTG